MEHYQKSLRGAAANRERALQKYYANPAICMKCNKVIEVGPFTAPSIIKRSRKFCSQSCSASYNNPLKLRSTTEGPCEKCGQTVPYTKKADKQGIKQGYRKVRFCFTCRALARQETFLETKKAQGCLTWDILLEMTKEELFNSFDRNHYPFKVRLTSHARTIWNKLGRPNTCIICGFQHVDICHIKPVKEFSGTALIKEINSPDNLIGLCPNHHWMFDRGLLDITNINHKRQE